MAFLTQDELAANWNLNTDLLDQMGIPADLLGKLVKLERGGYGKIAGLNPSKRKMPFQITFTVNGQNRVISADLVAFKKIAKCYLPH